MHSFHSQANDKMKRWNDYYDSMTPKKTSNKTPAAASASTSARTRAGSSHRLSMFARKLKQRNLSAAPTAPTNQVSNAAKTSVQPERYIPRKDEIETASHRTDQPMPESNFAWVD